MRLAKRHELVISSCYYISRVDQEDEDGNSESAIHSMVTSRSLRYYLDSHTEKLETSIRAAVLWTYTGIGHLPNTEQKCYQLYWMKERNKQKHKGAEKE
jgi:hypothetical protein